MTGRAAAAVLAGALALAAPAGATEVAVEVANDAAPSVRIVAPADGARLPAGVEVPVRIESRDGQRLWTAVDGTRVWSVRADVIRGAWAPGSGRHRIVAVAERDGAPDAVAVAEVVGLGPPAALTPASPIAPPPPGPGGRGAPRPPRALVPPAPRTAPGASAPGAPAPVGPATPGAAGPTGAAGASAEEDGGGGGWTAPLRALFADPERVAWGVALPLLLMIAGGAYLLLQRLIDGGQKLAWRGRGRPDDAVVEF